jgi:enoyl-CoA hydratase/carnithine racemase
MVDSVMGHVTIETEGAVRVVRMTRPEKKNALTVAMYDAITAALQDAERDPAIRATLIEGMPGIFTAGNDLGDFLENPPTGEDSAVFRLLLVLADLEKPLLAAVDGPAVGLGTTMLLHCDMVVASTRARFQMPFVTLGLVPEGASSVILPVLAGMQRATQWLMLGESIDVDTAHRVGLVNQVVAPEAVGEAARKLAQAVASRPPEAIRLTKQLLRGPLREQVKAALKREGALFMERLTSNEAVEAFTAFMARKHGG